MGLGLEGQRWVVEEGGSCLKVVVVRADECEGGGGGDIEI